LHGVVVEIDPERVNPYGVVWASDSKGRSPWGHLRWLEASDFELTGTTCVVPGRIYRKNEKNQGGTEMRGCACHCCEHQKGSEPEPDE
jgi:hypothetical protein